jgi:peroxiredoxin (alkyl hydroperoxide reductase subunit C)
VIDANGVVRWSYLSPINVNPGADGIFAALDKIAAESWSTPSEQPKTAPPRPEQRNEGEISAR